MMCDVCPHFCLRKGDHVFVRLGVSLMPWAQLCRWYTKLTNRNA
jgi:hypothetical protein